MPFSVWSTASPYAVALVLAALLCALCGVIGWRRRAMPGGTYVALAMAAAAAWALFYAFELAAPTLGAKVLWGKAQYLGITVLPVAWFLFARSYTGAQVKLGPARLALISLIPAATILLVATNELHGLVWQEVSLGTSGAFPYLALVHGPWFWVACAYSYGFLTAGTFLLFRGACSYPSLHRRQISLLMLAALTPWVVNALRLLDLLPMRELNPTPLAFAFAGLLLAVDISRFGLLSLQPPLVFAAQNRLFEEMKDSVLILDGDGRIAAANPAARRMLGKRPAGLIGKPAEELLSGGITLPECRDQKRQKQFEMALGEETHRRDFDVVASPLGCQGGASIGHLLVFRDITQHKRTQQALDAERERLSLLHRTAVEMSTCHTPSQVERTGVQLAQSGIACDGAVFWVSPSRIRGHVVGSEGLTRKGRVQLTRALRTSPAVEGAIHGEASVLLGPEELLEEGSCDEGLFAAALAVPVRSGGKVLGMLCLAVQRDHPVPGPADAALAEGVASHIGTALENAYLYSEARLLAQRDHLTDLLNHGAITSQLEKDLARSERSHDYLAVVMMDLDDLKLINDTHGHMAGDRVLQDVATALAKSIRRGDSVGRYGGDEFVALLPSTDAAGALPIVERIREAVSNLTWPKEDGSFAPVSMSYGVSVYPHCGLDATELLAAADANLYRSKRLGGDRITLPPRHSKTDRTARLSPLLRLPTASGDQ